MVVMESEYTAEEWQRINNEFKRIKDTVYLDHAGATLYSEPQLAAVYALLGSTLIANPHTTKHTEDLIDQVRYRILTLVNASADEYSVVFTSGATAALKTVAECFAFDGATADSDGDADDATDGRTRTSTSENGCFAHLADNHTSVLGMRAIVRTPHIVSVPHEVFVSAASGPLDKSDEEAADTACHGTNSLFVYPGQCNFSGYKYPLDIIPSIQRSGPTAESGANTNWFVMLDAASLVATAPLDLHRHPADFVCVSFYKLFGYPTGLGALLVSRRGQRVLHKRYYGGGTVQIALAARNWHRKRGVFHERFEDGTVPFLSIAALLAGFDTLQRLVPANAQRSTMQRIRRHCFRTAGELRRQLAGLRYGGGASVVRFYADTAFEEENRQGGIVNFNVLNERGGVVGFREVAEIAEVYGVRLRTGCFCNPGACQRHLGLSDAEVRGHFNAGHVCGDLIDLIDGVPTGSVRLSVGYMTSQRDIDRVVRMLSDTYIGTAIPINPRANPIRSNGTTSTPVSPTSVVLNQICVYPIKSCAPHRIDTNGARWPLTERGLRYDREWMIVNGRTGVALTQKTNTSLCLVQPHLDTRRGRMRLRFAADDSDAGVSVPLSTADTDEVDFAGTLCQSKVCGDRIEGLDCGDAVAKWLADVLCESDVRLIRQSADDRRRFRRKRDDSAGQRISLANQAPFLLINMASVDWLIERVDAWTSDGRTTDAEKSRRHLQTNTVDRFRANLVVDAGPGAVALSELEWRGMRSSGCHVAFRVQGPCTRCQMICIDQASGEKTAEPLRTIANVFGGKMRFGVYMEYAAEWPADGEEKEMFLECGGTLNVSL